MDENQSATRPIVQIAPATATKVVTPTQEESLAVNHAANPKRATVTAIQHAAQ